MTPAALGDFASFIALPREQRRAVAHAVASELGPSFRAGRALAGQAQLCTVVHVPSKLTFVLIPGGTFTMGLTAADRAAFERFFPRHEHPALHAAFMRTVPLMTLPREVRVGPFALAVHALQGNALTFFSGDEHPESFERGEAETLVSGWGFRLPSEAEWEYVAREGEPHSFLLDVATAHFESGARREDTRWGIAYPGQTVWVADRWHRGYRGAPKDGSPWTAGRGLPMHRGSFSLGLDAMQSADELVFAMTALRQEPRGADDENEVWVRLALGPDEAGRWTLKPSAPLAASRAAKPKRRAVPGPAAQPPVSAPSEGVAGALPLLPADATVRACVEIALTGGNSHHRPEPTWPQIIEAGAKNAVWAQQTLDRIEHMEPPPPLRSMAMFGMLYPLAVAGMPVQAKWTRSLDLVAPPRPRSSRTRCSSSNATHAQRSPRPASPTSPAARPARNTARARCAFG